MKTFLKVVSVIVLVVVALAALGVTYLTLRKPAQRAASAERIAASPERIERGRYLATHVTGCFACHSERTYAYAMPFVPGREGVGGHIWDKRSGFAGVLAAPNITPDPETGLGNWTDGEIVRAIREGVDRNGTALFPIMPYTYFSSMSDEDAASIVAYLRTLRPLTYARPARSLDVPLNFVVKFLPKPLDGPVRAPDPRDHLAYGKYLTTIALCAECHTPRDERDAPLAEQEFTGGWEMRTSEFRVVTSNITPHPSTFVGRATKEEFIGRFRAFAQFDIATAPPAAKGRNTIMPWISYAGMTDADLGAIYDYLRTLPPVDKAVNPFPDAR